MAENGKYYSPFLLTVLCAHASRFHDAKIGEALIGRARLLLGQEIQKPSSIPTVQALLQLSAREMAYGSMSQAWLYSGMAFRMSTDLGLHHNHGKLLSLGQLSAEDMEIRRRLFWSCYFWDKYDTSPLFTCSQEGNKRANTRFQSYQSVSGSIARAHRPSV